jgi:hypothetical protein
MIHSFGNFVNRSSDDEQWDFFTENRRVLFYLGREIGLGLGNAREQ